MKFFICISLFIVIIGAAVNAHAKIVPNRNYGNENRLTVDSNGMDDLYLNNKKKLVRLRYP